jgi:hypothetical protein
LNLHGGLARIGVTVSVLLAVLSFIVGPVAYKALVKPSFYVVPGAGESLIQAFGRAQAAHLPASPEIKRDRSHGETTPGLLSPLPLSARTDLPLWKWALIGVMTALAGFVAIAVAIGVTARVIRWIRDGFWGERSSDQGLHPEYEHCIEDPVVTDTIDIDILAPAEGLCYEELVGPGSQGFDLRDGTGAGQNGRLSRSEDM